MLYPTEQISTMNDRLTDMVALNPVFRVSQYQLLQYCMNTIAQLAVA